MRKLLPYLRLAMFSLALFGASGVVVLLKQERLWKQKHEEKNAAGGEAGGTAEAATAEPNGGAGHDVEAKAGMTNGLDAADPSDASSSAGIETKPSGPEEEKRQLAVESGRALFEVPEPISIKEATELLNDLRRQKEENAKYKAALDLHAQQLETMEKDLETRRNALAAMADEIHASVPADAGKGAEDQFDPTTVARIAKILESMQPNKAAQTLLSYKPESAAQVLLKMKENKSGPILAEIDAERLTKITDALLKAKPQAEGE